MKTYILKRIQALIVCLISFAAFGLPSPNLAPINFSFNFDFASQPDLQNFWLYYGTASSNYTSKVSMGKSTNIIIAVFPRNTLLFFNSTAMTTNGVEGDFTTEISLRTLNKPKTLTAFKASQ